MKKRTFIPYLAALVCSPLFSVDRSPQKPCRGQGEPLGCEFPVAYNAPAAVDIQAPDRPNDSWSPLIQGSFTYWFAGEEGLNIAVTSAPSAKAIEGPMDFFFKILSRNAAAGGFVPRISGTTLVQSSDYKPGFKVRAGGIANREWMVYAEYAWYRGRNKTSAEFGLSPLVEVIGGSSSVPAWFPNNWFIQPFAGLIGSRVSSTWKISMDLVDAVVSRPFYEGKRVVISPFGGLRAAFIRQSVIVKLDQSLLIASGNAGSSTTLFQPIGSRNHSNSWAVGPRIGIDSQCLVGKGFRFEGDVAGSVLYTRYTSVKHSEDADFVIATPGPYKISTPSFSRVRPVLEFALGVGWATYLSNQTYHIDFSTSYEFMIFWAQNVIRESLDAFTTTMNPSAGDLYFHGLTFSGRFDF